MSASSSRPRAKPRPDARGSALIRSKADALARAADERQPIAPIGDELAPLGVDGAYAVQERLTSRALAAGRRLVGRKIGLTSKAVQAQLRVDQPDYGMLFADMEFGDGEEVPFARFIQPKVEAELAFCMERELTDPQASLTEVIGAIAYVLPAIEIVDSRIADWKISFADTVADNGSSAFFLLADAGRPLAGLDLEGAAMEMTVNGAVASTGVGAAALGNPLNAAAWLARTLAARGEPLKAGDILLAGALGPMVALTPGDAVIARVAGIGECRFTYGN